MGPELISPHSYRLVSHPQKERKETSLLAKVSNVPEATTALQSQDQTFCYWAGPQLLRNAVRNTRRPHPFLFNVVPLTMGTCWGKWPGCHPGKELWVKAPRPSSLIR